MSESCDPMDCSRQAPLSTGFSKREHWSGLPFPSPEDLPNPGIKTGSPALQAHSLLSEPPGKTLMLGKIEGKRRRGKQRMMWLDSITDSMDMNQSKFRGEGQGSLVCCSPWGCKESDRT